MRCSGAIQVRNAEESAGQNGRCPERRITPVRGEHLGQRNYRIKRSDLPGFQRVGRRLVATEATSRPEGRGGRLLDLGKHLLLGRPLDSEKLGAERLSVLKALPILSSDPLSSVAYGPEAGLVVLAGAGAGALIFSVPIAVAVASLMVVVTASYVQVVRGYQRGGGSYAVAAANLGRRFGLVAAAALLVDYVLTVAVSIASGVDALASAFGAIQPFEIGLGLLFVGLLVLGNLRGVREAGDLFAGPTYVFIGCLLLLVALGLIHFLDHHRPLAHYSPLPGTEVLSAPLILVAFASTCASMTGIESVSNSVPVFKAPSGLNAAKTLTTLGALLVVLFLGVIALDVIYAAEPRTSGNPTVLSQLAADVFTGPARPLFYLTQLSTLAVLILAANASFNGFPRLAAILAGDDFLPHRFMHLGNRLVHSSAILLLATAAAVLIVAFAGNVDQLINLYALGVFSAFTLAQAGMARHWWRSRSPGWQVSLAINFVGATVTAVVDMIIIYTKTPRGAWIVLVIVPLLLAIFLGIHRHYHGVRSRLSSARHSPGRLGRGPVVVPVRHENGPTLTAVSYGRGIGTDVVVVHVARTEQQARLFHEAWANLPGVQLRVAVGRRPVKTILHVVDQLVARHPAEWVTVVLPESSQPVWQETIRHPRTLLLKLALLRRPSVIAASLPTNAEAFPAIDPKAEHVAFVPIARMDAPTVKALSYAADVMTELVAVHVSTEDPAQADPSEALRRQFNAWVGSHGLAHRATLMVIESPYRAIAEPLLYFFLDWRNAHPDALCTVVLPEVIDLRPWNALLHNHRAFWLKAMLLRHSTVGVADITFDVRASDLPNESPFHKLARSVSTRPHPNG